ncbi:MAG: flagellar biosynthetic protein FliQ [Acidobacteria bacterium]|nr:flagellar biosynthetic protein FliQ [Acidobacteriota bacterium]
MNADLAVEVIRQAFWNALFVGGPILLIGFVAGIVVSLVQIVTSMQDPAFNSVPRLLVFLFAAMLLLPWMADHMILYTETLFGNLDRFAH